MADDASESGRGDGARKAQRARRASRFVLSSVVAAVVVGIIAYGVLIVVTMLSELVDLDPNQPDDVHWASVVVPVVLIYALFCCLFAVRVPRTGWVRAAFRAPSWVELRNFGEERFARASYLALGIIPLVVYLLDLNPFQLDWVSRIGVPENLKTTFFVAFSFSVALVIFGVGCPKELRRPDAAERLRAAAAGVEPAARPADSEADLDALDRAAPLLRAVCWSFYLSGLVLLLVLFYRSASLVWNAG